MKKFLSVILALAMAMSLSVSAFAADFNDVSSSHTNYEAIDTLKTLDIVNGYSATKYGPNDILTRAQLCTMIVRAVYGDDTHYNSVNVFNDVSVSHWARIYIDTAYNHGIMSGYGNGTFGPEDQLTYTQTARVILNILGYGKLDWPLGVNTVAYELGLYDDVAVSDFDAGCTRAHAAQMIYNAFDLELVKEYAGQHFGTNKYFLADVLGYKEVSEYIDGHLYVAYKDLNDKDADLLVTDIRSTFEKTIYPCGTNEYKFVDSNRADKFKFDWAKVDLFVNGVDVNDSTWFVNAESVIGVFDDKDNLIAIYVTNKGDVYIPGKIPNNILNKVKNDKNFDSRTSTITYFVEDDTYVISNKIVCGFVSDISNKSIWIDNVKYTLGADHGFEIDEFAVIYIDSNNEIAGWTTIDEPYYFNVKTMKYHTWECFYYNDRANNNNWCIGEDAVIKYFIDNDKTNTTVRFDACKDCHADGRYAVSIPASVIEPTYVSAEGWLNYHVIDCPNLNDADKLIATEYNVTSGTKTPCATCIH